MRLGGRKRRQAGEETHPLIREEEEEEEEEEESKAQMRQQRNQRNYQVEGGTVWNERRAGKKCRIDPTRTGSTFSREVLFFSGA